MSEDKGWGEDREELGGENGAGLPEGRPAGPGLPAPGSAGAPPGGAGEAGAKTEGDEAAEGGGGEYFAGVGDEVLRVPLMAGARKGSGGRKLVKPKAPEPPVTAERRLILLDLWQKSKLPATAFAALVGYSAHTLYTWKKLFEEQGPGGLADKPRGGAKGSRLAELTKRTILMLKEAHPEWGCERISDMLVRGPGLAASASAVARLLHESGYELEESATPRHPDKVRSFERARPNQLWQTDIFTFLLKRQNRRVHLIGFLDDHSRFLVSYGLHASATTNLVLEVLEAGIASWGAPQEVLTDNGPQYSTWRGKSDFTRALEKRGIKQIVAHPRRPQTVGKIERFWGTLWRECVEAAIFADLAEARKRIGLFIDYYNFQRPHQGIEGLAPADRFFGAAPEMLATLKARVEANALELARQGSPKEKLYLAGQVGGKQVSLHAEGGKVILRQEGEEAKEVDLGRPEASAAVVAESAAANPAADLPEPVCPQGAPAGGLEQEHEEAPAPGTSALDELMA
jgi:transposase InsO family protein